VLAAQAFVTAFILLIAHIYIVYTSVSGCTVVGGKIWANGRGTRLDLDDCHISGSYLGTACIYLSAGGSGTLRCCTVQVGEYHRVSYKDVQDMLSVMYKICCCTSLRQ
jgi:hypothetical protein